jgi:hypothetical protein
MLRRIVPVVLCLIVLPLRAQERCRATDTPRICFERWVAGSVANPQAPPAQAVRMLLMSVNEGTSDLNAPIRASLKDFLTVVSASVDSAVVGGDATGVSFGYTPPVDVGGHLRIETKFAKPVLSEQTLTVVTTPEARKQLEDSLTALDDVTYALSYDWTTRFFGRSVERHLPLLAALVPPPADAQARFEGVLVSRGITAADAPKSFREMNHNVVAFEEAVRAVFAPTQIEIDFASLLNNQPQLYVTAFRNVRHEVVGPSRRGASLTVELSGRNLNGFYRYEGRDCGDACAGALQAYLARVRDPRNAPRLALSVEYSETEALAQAGLSPSDAVDSLVYSLTAGVPFASLVGGEHGRLELGVKYDGTETKAELVGFNSAIRIAPTRGEFEEPRLSPSRERFASAISFTQPLSERLSIPVSVVYSEVEYTLPTAGADTQLVREHDSAVHVGIRYRLVPPRLPRCGCR